MEVAILSFFTRHDPFFHHAKFQLPLRPPSTFLGVFWNCWQILSSKIFRIFFLCKIWVIAAPNKHFLGVWYQKWMRNKLLLLHFFSTFLNHQRTTLTYSALFRRWQLWWWSGQIICTKMIIFSIFIFWHFWAFHIIFHTPRVHRGGYRDYPRTLISSHIS